MKNPIRYLFIAGLILLVVLNGLVFFRVQSLLLDTRRALSMIIRVNSVKAKLDSFESEIWNIVYQPSTSKKVLDGRSKGYQTILFEIRKDIDFAKTYSPQGKPYQQIELVRRSVDSLARKADRLRAQLVLQSLDIDSTKVFLKDTEKTSMLAESHVVEMEEIMKKINDNVDVVNDNINQYAKEEVVAFAEMNERGLWEYHCWGSVMFVVNICFLFAGVVFLRRRESQA